MPKATLAEQLAELRKENKQLKSELDSCKEYGDALNRERTNSGYTISQLKRELTKTRQDLTRVSLAYDTVREVVNRTSISLSVEGLNPNIKTTTNFNPYPPNSPQTNQEPQD